MTKKRDTVPFSVKAPQTCWSSVQCRRLVCALVFVVALLGIAGLSGGKQEVDEGIDIVADDLDGSDPMELIEICEQKLEEYSAMPPDEFMTEVGLPVGARDVRYVEGSGVVGFVLDANPAYALECLNEHFAARGYSTADFVGVSGATYTKASGALTWVVGICTGTGDATSVVLRYAE